MSSRHIGRASEEQLSAMADKKDFVVSTPAVGIRMIGGLVPPTVRMVYPQSPLFNRVFPEEVLLSINETDVSGWSMEKVTKKLKSLKKKEKRLVFQRNREAEEAYAANPSGGFGSMRKIPDDDLESSFSLSTAIPVLEAVEGSNNQSGTIPEDGEVEMMQSIAEVSAGLANLSAAVIAGANNPGMNKRESAESHPPTKVTMFYQSREVDLMLDGGQMLSEVLIYTAKRAKTNANDLELFLDAEYTKAVAVPASVPHYVHAVDGMCELHVRDMESWL